MRSIKRRREVLEKINSADKVNSNESRLLGYLVLTEDYPDLLMWAERIKNEARCDSSADIDMDALLKIIDELPE